MKAKQLALDALKLLDKTLQFTDWESCDGEEIGEQLRSTVAALEADIAKPVDPFGWVKEHSSFVSGKRLYSFTTNKQHVIDWAASGITLEPVYTTPPEPAVNAELLEALKDAAAVLEEARAAIAKATS